MQENMSDVGGDPDRDLNPGTSKVFFDYVHL